MTLENYSLITVPRKMGKSALMNYDFSRLESRVLARYSIEPLDDPLSLLAWAVLVDVRPLGVINSYVAQQKKGELPPRGQKRRSEKLRQLILDKLTPKSPTN